MSNTIKIAKVMLHKFEEPIISAGNGSGAIFFSGCSLKCLYCQNWEISHENSGIEISIMELANIFKRLEDAGANNINLVSPTHYTYQIISALKIYKPKIPIIWNTSGYESLATLEIIKDYIDIYLTDIKYCSSTLSGEFSSATNYFEKASLATIKMREYQPVDVIVNGLMQKGLIVRHLILPSCIEDSFKVLDFIKKFLGKETIVSIMSQYTPCFKAINHSTLNRKITPLEYKIVTSYALKLELNNSYVQEESSATTDCTPDFRHNIFEI
ncbi:MAG: radical SAM protein [Clostridia bacterium]